MTVYIKRYQVSTIHPTGKNFVVAVERRSRDRDISFRALHKGVPCQGQVNITTGK